MVKWKSNKGKKTEWVSGDFLIKEAEAVNRIKIYHCYLSGDYIAQGANLEDAKKACDEF